MSWTLGWSEARLARSLSASLREPTGTEEDAISAVAHHGQYQTTDAASRVSPLAATASTCCPGMLIRYGLVSPVHNRTVLARASCRVSVALGVLAHKGPHSTPASALQTEQPELRQLRVGRPIVVGQPVAPIEHRRVQVLMPNRQRAHFVLGFLHGLGTHPPGPDREYEPQEVESHASFQARKAEGHSGTIGRVEVTAQFDAAGTNITW